jgi:hypothetical protein
MPYVSGNQRKILFHCRGGDEQIQVGNELTLLSQRGAQPRKVFDDGIRQRQGGEIAEEVAQPGEGRLRIGCAEGAFVDLGDGNDADGEALAAEAIQGALRVVGRSRHR